MKKIILTSGSALLLSIAAMSQTPAGTSGQTTPMQATPMQTTPMQSSPMQTSNMPTLTKDQLDKHPEIAKALDNLHQAEHNLGQATDTYQGHKEKALELLHQAEAELIQGVVDHK